MPRLATALLALALGAAAAFALVACGEDSGDTQELLPGDKAEEILTNLDAVEEAVGNGDCEQAAANVETIQSQIAALDKPVSKELRQNLSEGANLLAERIAEDCEKAETAPEKTTETTGTTETTDTTDQDTTEDTTDKEPTSPEEPTTEPTPTEPEPPTEPPTQPEPPTTPPDDSGGVSPGGVGGGDD